MDTSATVLNALMVIAAVFVLLPSVTGIGLGGLVSFLVDFVKAVTRLAGKTLPPELGGKLVVLANGLVFLVVFAIFLIMGKGNPMEVGMSEEGLVVVADLMAVIEAATAFFNILTPEIVAGFLVLVSLTVNFFMSLFSGQKVHDMLKRFAPSLVSLKTMRAIDLRMGKTMTEFKPVK